MKSCTLFYLSKIHISKISQLSMCFMTQSSHLTVCHFGRTHFHRTSEQEPVFVFYLWHSIKQMIRYSKISIQKYDIKEKKTKEKLPTAYMHIYAKAFSKKCESQNHLPDQHICRCGVFFPNRSGTRFEVKVSVRVC